MKTQKKEQSENSKSLGISLEMNSPSELNIVCTAIDRLDKYPYQRFMQVTEEEQKDILKETDKAKELASSARWKHAFPNSQGSGGAALVRSPDSPLYKEFPTINKIADKARAEFAECFGIDPKLVREELRYVRSDSGFDWHADEINTIGYIITFGDAPSTNLAKSVVTDRGKSSVDEKILGDNYETVPPGGAVVFRRYDAVHARASHSKEKPRLILFLDIPTAEFGYKKERIVEWRADITPTASQEKARAISDKKYKLTGNDINLSKFDQTPHQDIAIINVAEAVIDEIRNQPNSTILELKKLDALSQTADHNLSISNIVKQAALGTLVLGAGKILYSATKKLAVGNKHNAETKHMDKKLESLKNKFEQLLQKREELYNKSPSEELAKEVKEFKLYHEEAIATIAKLKELNEKGFNQKQPKKKAEIIMESYSKLNQAIKSNAEKKAQRR